MSGHRPPDPPYRSHVDRILSGTATKEGVIDAHTVITHIAKIGRRPNTGSGNPRWRLLTRHGIYETEPDAQVAHQIEQSWTHRPRPMVRLVLNDAGRVIGIAAVPDDYRQDEPTGQGTPTTPTTDDAA
jgi:hypothetical protein